MDIEEEGESRRTLLAKNDSSGSHRQGELNASE